ncbi:expressed unknown protein [Seminavis robusta]|uniref:Uncharacterized protein n=1 Tax=Seminavis robusta TaxID=568900 RepID=A0A9N8HD28_9STRA|nr:expressed unknown protein [Seminavis robusta]|eukprot:Sro243_g096940.1 n/a (854) ;mRNA; f:52851-55412
MKSTVRQTARLLLLLGVLVTVQSSHGAPTNRHLANMSPKEKDVMANPICSVEALTAADISGNDFISRAEYVNLLLDLAPADCHIIDMWLNDQPLKQTFEKLSCLCHEFGGIDGENNCCLQAVNVPMLAAFATPNSYYPEEYAATACAMIDQVLVQQCPSTLRPTLSPTSSPTKSPKTTTTTNPPTPAVNNGLGLSVTTFETISPSALPTTAPTPDDTLEMTEAGELVEVVIEGGEVTTTTNVGEDDQETTNLGEEEDEEETPVEPPPEEEETLIDEAGSNDNDSSEELLPEPSSPAPKEDSVEELPTEDVGPSSGLTETGSMPAQQEDIARQTAKETPVGIILAVLLVITFMITLGLFAMWGTKRGYMENPWKKPTEMTVNTASSGDDMETPRRSNTRRSQSFSSDEEDALSDDDDDDDDDDVEVGKRRSKKGQSNNNGIVRAEFQDDLSVWGRRKRRRQERKQRREERQRQSLEQNPPQHQNTITTILSTLEFDLSGGSLAGIANGPLRPSSTKSMGSMRSGAGSVMTPKENMVDIFDDKSDTSSFDGSPHHLDGPMPVETSIEDWLDHLQCKSRINADGSIVHDDRSVMSHLSVTSKRSTTSSRRSTSMSPDKKLSRQPGDPVLQEWHSQRQQLNAANSIQRLGYNKFSAPASKSSGLAPYNADSSRSQSPQRSGHRSIGSASSYSPNQSPKPTYLLSSVSFSPSSSPKRNYGADTCRSEPASPVNNNVLVLQETLIIEPGSRADQQHAAETKDSDSPLYSVKRVSVTKQVPSSGEWNPLQLDLPVEHTHHPTDRNPAAAAPRLSPDSREFYETVLRMEPSEEDDEESRGNAFAFEAARPRNTPAPERYLV